MSSNPNTDSDTAEQSETMDLATAQRVEQEKMTRRAALRKLGFGAGVAAFGLLGVDDFARMVGQRLERMAGDSKVAAQVAKEFQSAGIALASIPYYPYSQTPCCSHCTNQEKIDLDKCLATQKAYTNAHPSGYDVYYYQALSCENAAIAAALTCDGHCDPNC